MKETYQRELPALQKQPQGYSTGIGAEEEFLKVSQRMSLLHQRMLQREVLLRKSELDSKMAKMDFIQMLLLQ